MSNDRVRIVVTDEKSTKTIGYINCSKDYVFGQVTKGSIGEMTHTTYHKNGYMHLKAGVNTPNPKLTPLFYGPPLKEFTGFVTTEVTAVSSDDPRKAFPEFSEDQRPYDHITHIDVSEQKFGMKYQGFISEPGFPISQLVDNARFRDIEDDRIDNTISYHVYTGVRPWVGVIYWPQMSTVHNIEATREFRPMGVAATIKANDDPYEISCPNGRNGCDGPTGTGPLCLDCYHEIDSE